MRIKKRICLADISLSVCLLYRSEACHKAYGERLRFGWGDGDAARFTGDGDDICGDAFLFQEVKFFCGLAKFLVGIIKAFKEVDKEDGVVDNWGNVADEFTLHGLFGGWPAQR